MFRQMGYDLVVIHCSGSGLIQDLEPIAPNLTRFGLYCFFTQPHRAP